MLRFAPLVLCLLGLALEGCGTTPPTCPSSTTECEARCVDLQTDERNCGACGTACPSGQVCAGGSCQTSCLQGQLLCGGKCVDPMTDRAFCGASADCTGPNDGTACPSGQVCAGGTCQASCLQGQLLCGGTCVDPLTNRTFCGASNDCTGPNAGTPCSASEVCNQGSCGTYCQQGFVDCGGTCVDPLTDHAFCGATGNCAGANTGTACGPLELCILGACLNNDATLSALTVSAGALNPQFLPGTTLYVVPVLSFVRSVVVTPTAAAGAKATLTVNGSAVMSGGLSAPIALQTSGLTSIRVHVRAEGGAERDYDLVVVGGSPTSTYLKASNTDANDQFANQSIALSGDTLAVGVPFEASSATGTTGDATAQANNGANRSGAVYIFTRTNGAWSQQAYLKASNTGANDQFGFSVALSGNTLAVGARREDSSATGPNGDAAAQANNGAPDSGAVYVFTRSSGAWTQQAYLKASNTGTNDQFGFGVALDGDTLAVSAVFEDSSATGAGGDLSAQADNSASNSGAVYVFTRSNGAWTQQAYLKASNTDVNDEFGTSLALSGNTLAVGAVGESSSATGVPGDAAAQADNGTTYAGAVYVFTRSSGAWTQQAYLKASNTDVNDEFGYSVALDKDTLVVGAPYESSSAVGINANATAQADNTALYSGAAYVFTRTGVLWSQQAYLKASNTDSNDQFGTSVAVWGDIVAVGATNEASSATGLNGNQTDNSAGNSGAVYVYTRSGGTWTQSAYVKATNTNASDSFGYCLALTGDALAVGAPYEASSATGVNGDQSNNSALDSGAVYVLGPPVN